MIGSILDTWHYITSLPGMIAALPWPIILASIVVGMILGAWLKWPGVLAVLTIGVGLFFISRNKPDEPAHEHVAGRDAVPAPRKPRAKVETRQSEWFRKATGQD